MDVGDSGWGLKVRGSYLSSTAGHGSERGGSRDSCGPEDWNSPRSVSRPAASKPPLKPGWKGEGRRWMGPEGKVEEGKRVIEFLKHMYDPQGGSEAPITAGGHPCYREGIGSNAG